MQATDSPNQSSYTFSCTYSNLNNCNFPLGNQNNQSAKVNVYYFTDPSAPDTLTVSQTPAAVPPAAAQTFASKTLPTVLATIPSLAQILTVPPGSVTTMTFSDTKFFKTPLTVNFVFETVKTKIDKNDVASSLDANKLKQNTTLSVHVVSDPDSGVPTGTVTFAFKNAAAVVKKLQATIDGTGTATINADALSKLDPGTYDLMISYDGGDKFMQSDIVTFSGVIVSSPPKPVSLTIGPKTAVVESNSSAKVPVTASSTGGTCLGTLSARVTMNGNDVTPTLSPTENGSGPWTITFPTASAGQYTITATYAPTDLSAACAAGNQTTTISLP
ncbi:Ig-like domain repeat protein [Acidicapsa acidisoli]|uniref:Ig-like domain repeat protein n=1 Tax=Acidicapsa acidisoli TaxID=1615681 RepID=UPI0021E0F0A8|nr:Ig-like domain repeat protein [Acidicapsa acidisoli]